MPVQSLLLNSVYAQERHKSHDVHRMQHGLQNGVQIRNTSSGIGAQGCNCIPSGTGDADNDSVGSHTCGLILVHTCGVYSRLSTMSSGIPKELLIMTLTAAFGPPLAWINMRRYT